MVVDATSKSDSAGTEGEKAGFAEQMISYSQNSEDVLLRRLSPQKTDGFYIDVGAHHPLHDSVTRYFYGLGWHGINIEPLSGAYQQLCEERTRDTNLNIGLSNIDSSATFYESLSHPALSTFDEDIARLHIAKGEKFQERTVSLTTLADVCAKHVASEIDFLSIDVEGLERQVLEGADFERWRPRVILIESTYPNSSRQSHTLWEDLFLRADYTFAFFDGLNRFYLRSEDANLLDRLAAPANVFDSFIPFRHYTWLQESEASQLRLEKDHVELEQMRTELEWHRQNCGTDASLGRLARAWRAFNTQSLE